MIRTVPGATPEAARAPFQVGRRADGPAVTPDGREVWVPSPDANEVFVLNGQTGGVERTLRMPSAPESITISRDGTTAYVTLATAGTIAVVDIARATITGFLALSGVDSNT
jgi:DNA-binding beta-propeller fold protein YncE